MTPDEMTPIPTATQRAGAGHDTDDTETLAAERAALADDPESAACRERIVESALRCIRALLVALGRGHERCGKAACLRARRCRGLACEPDRRGHGAAGTRLLQDRQACV